MRFEMSSFFPLAGALKVSAGPFTQAKQESKPPNPQHKIVPIYAECHNLINKPGFVLHRQQMPWGSVQNSTWHLQILCGKAEILFLTGAFFLRSTKTTSLKKSFPYKVLSNRRWGGHKIYQSHTLGFDSGPEEEEMLKLCPKADILFFPFFFLMKWETSITWFAVTEEAQAGEQLLIAMWEMDPTILVLAGQG